MALARLRSQSGAERSGPDKRCRLEARIARRPPVSVTHVAPTFAQTIDGALHTLVAALTHALGRLQDAQPRRPPHHGLADAGAAGALDPGVAADDADGSGGAPPARARPGPDA